MTCSASETVGAVDATVMRCEHLRTHAVAGRTSSVRYGLAVMLQRGMAAWLAHVSLLPMAAEGQERVGTEGGEVFADARCDEFVDLLTQLALARLTEAAP